MNNLFASLSYLAALPFKFISKMWVEGPRSVTLGTLVFLALQPFAAASITWNSSTFNVNTAIPDNDDAGITSTQAVSGTGITQIESVTVTLNVTGGWNGDLYAYLIHGTGFAVLLNRPGRSLADPDGAASSGMNISFADSEASDIHTDIPLVGGLVIGNYQPDGRITDPLLVLNTDARPAMLSTFSGLDPSGNWTLFIADQSSGEISTLGSWSMTITGVPEPSAVILGALGMMLLLRRNREFHAPC